MRIQPGSIVVGTDGSLDADRAVRWAAEQAVLERRDLVVLAAVAQMPALVAAGPGTAYAFAFDDLRTGALAIANEAVAVATRHRPGLHVRAAGTVGNPRNTLVAAAEQAHLLVLGSRGRGPVSSKLLGSVSAAVTRLAECPVVVCRPTRAERVSRGVVVGADGTQASLPVVDFAFRQASLRSEPLTVVHAGDDDELTELLVAETLAGFGERYPEVAVTVHATRGFAADALVALAADHELIVVGRHSLDTVADRFSATTATAVLERAPSTVAVVPEASAHPTH